MRLRGGRYSKLLVMSVYGVPKWLVGFVMPNILKTHPYNDPAMRRQLLSALSPLVLLQPGEQLERRTHVQATVDSLGGRARLPQLLKVMDGVIETLGRP